MITQEMKDNGLICNGKGFNCIYCKDKKECVDYMEAKTSNMEHEVYYKNTKYKFVEEGCHVVIYMNDKLWGCPQMEHGFKALLQEIRVLESK